MITYAKRHTFLLKVKASANHWSLNTVLRHWLFLLSNDWPHLSQLSSGHSDIPSDGRRQSQIQLQEVISIWSFTGSLWNLCCFHIRKWLCFKCHCISSDFLKISGILLIAFAINRDFEMHKLQSSEKHLGLYLYILILGTCTLLLQILGAYLVFRPRDCLKIVVNYSVLFYTSF